MDVDYSFSKNLRPKPSGDNWTRLFVEFSPGVTIANSQQWMVVMNKVLF